MLSNLVIFLFILYLIYTVLVTEELDSMNNNMADIEGFIFQHETHTFVMFIVERLNC